MTQKYLIASEGDGNKLNQDKRQTKYKKISAKSLL
jgi:hypothetical protein